MTRHLRLTDAQLRAALAPAPDLAAPSGLLAAIAADVARTPQRRRRLRLPAPPGTPIGAWLRHDPRLAWVALAALLLLAALAGALIAGAMLRGQPERRLDPEIPLIPTGVEILVPESRVFDRVMVDGRGTYWAAGPGRLTRFDPGTGERRTWTVADDAAFSGAAAAPARDGGVWISDRTRLLRFTGVGFADLVQGGPIPAMAMLQDPGGSLWAVDWEDGPLRWDGRAWQPLPAGRPTTRAGIMTVTTGGDVWVSNLNAPDAYPLGAGISRLSAGRWTTWDGSEQALFDGEIGAIEEAVDGSIWVTNSAASMIARFAGGTWLLIEGPGFPAWWLEAAPDGSMWAVTAEAGVARVARYVDGSWTTFDESDGIAGTGLGQVSATPAGVFLATNAGLLRLAGDRWEPAWPDAADGPDTALASSLVALSVDEAWATDQRGAWHFLDGRWEGPTQPEPFQDKWISSLAVAPDGAVWLAGQAGVAVLRDGVWSMVLDDEARKVVVTPDGAVWVGRQSPGIVRLQRSGTGFTTESISCPVGATSMVAAPDGTIWLGSFAYAGWPGLARFDGESCTVVDVLGDGRTQELTAIVMAPDGGIAAELLEDTRASSTSADARWTSRLVRLEGAQWTVLEQLDDVDGALNSLTFDPSGGLWRASRARSGLERLDGSRWVPGPSELVIGGQMTFAPDGSLWSLGPSGIQRVPASRLAAD